MKTAALLGALLLTLFIAPSPSHAAGGRTVEMLLKICENDTGMELIVCDAVIGSVASVLSLNCGYSTKGYSMPEALKADVSGATNGALIQAFKNWASDNPQALSVDERTGVIIALASTFPCNN